MENPARYRQLLPVFDDADLRAVFLRTLHYSLNIAPGCSILTEPLDPAWRALPDFSSRWQAALERADGLIAGCQRTIEATMARFGCSWVDWGAYRHVVRPGDPFVQVWKDARKAL